MEAAHEVLFNADLLLNHVAPHLSFADFGRLRMVCKGLMDIVDRQASQWRMLYRGGVSSGLAHKAIYDVIAPLYGTIEISTYYIAERRQRLLWAYFVHGNDTWNINIRYSSVDTSILSCDHRHFTTPPWMTAMCCRATEAAWAELVNRLDTWLFFCPG